MSFRNLLLSIIFLFSAKNIQAQHSTIGSWRDELPYRNAISVVQSVNKIYCATPVSLFSVNKSDNSFEKLSKANGLSDVGFSTLFFDTEREQLLVAYSNSNLDLMDATGTYNISDIKRKNIVGDKNIYEIFMNGNFAYLSCGFGVVVLNLVKREISETYYPGETTSYNRANSFSSDGNYFYAATANGLYRASKQSANLADFSQWILISGATGLPAGEAKQIFNFENLIFCNVKDSLFKFDGSSWTNIFSRSDYHISSINDGENSLLLCMNSDSANHPSKVMLVFSDGTVDSLQVPFANPQHALKDESGNYWIADESAGLLKFSLGINTPLYPLGPWSKNASDISISNHVAFVAPGTVSGFNYQFNQDGYFLSYDGYWINFNKYATGGVLDSAVDFFKCYTDPKTGDGYFGSFGYGLLKVEQSGSTTYYDQQNSSLRAPSGDPRLPRVTGMAIDADRNFWVSNYGATNPLSVLTVGGTWKSFHPGSNTGDGKLYDMVIDQNNYKWIVLPLTGILVYDSGEDPLATNDDHWKTLTSGIGKGALPNNDVQCLAVDKDGYVWVGTDAGVAVFYCAYDVFSANGCDAQQIIVKQDLYNGYLLGTESINDMAVDGANRKWFATNSGVYLMSADGLTEIEHFTTDNSPLFSNNINCIAIDDLNGDVFIGTDLGIIVYRGDAIEGNSNSSLSDTAFIFPNPVRENFTGLVAIQKLAYQSEVKITDLSGTLVYETQSNGGEAIWNLQDLKGERVNTGVYLVYMVNADGLDKLVGKIAVAK